MSSEKFRPTESHYKKVEDLPEEHRDEFVNLPEDGFVRKEALEAYEKWEKLAQEANAGRSIFKKIFLLDKASALDFAHKEALKEDQERSQDEQAAKELERKMIKDFKGMFSESEGGSTLIEHIKRHEFDCIISEDASGRLPAEILQKALNIIYKKNGQQEVPLVSFPVGCDTTLAETKEILSDLVFDGKIGKGALYVTDCVSTGKTIAKVVKAMEDARVETLRAGQTQPEFYGFIIMGGYLPRELKANEARLRDREEYLKNFNENFELQMQDTRGTRALSAELIESVKRSTREQLEEEVRDLRNRLSKIRIIAALSSRQYEHQDAFYKQFAGVSKRKVGDKAITESTILPRSMQKLRDELVERVSAKLAELIEELSVQNI